MAISLNLLPRCLVLLHFVLCSLGAKVVTIDVREANNLIQTGHIYLDVRTVQEFVKGPRVNTSKIINIPYMLDTPKGKVKNLYFLKECSSLCNIEDHLVVGCQFGLRSLHATSDLLDGVSPFLFDEKTIFIHSNQQSTSIEIIRYSNLLKPKMDESMNKLTTSELIA
ncbi:thiosulfate sulfurtransferase 18-like isoform X1 [Trifolium pratense]|uniref:Uncharacterized protein n=1 Tax=Trifolium pratense TaxID=57577 RepID=A0ACB0JPC5_TRIPR|nr:thiosulfate sulfurtransferase 18-like isoform X1 [Trifolium pratense]CAJ2646601.1 unnamed protein product [Trifolium pratense]